MNRLIVAVIPFFMIAVSCTTSRDLPEIYESGIPPGNIPGHSLSLSYVYDLPVIPEERDNEVFSVERPVLPSVFEWNVSYISPDSGINIDIFRLPEIPEPEKRSLSSEQSVASGAVPAGPVPESSVRKTFSLEKESAVHPAAVKNTDTVSKAVEYETVIRPVGDNSTVKVSLSGTGWIYLGVGEGASGLSFISRMNRQGATDFYFKVDSPDTFRLKFQQQDPLSGNVIVHGIRLEVVDMTNGKISSEEEIPAVPDKTEDLSSLVEEGSYRKAFALYDKVSVLSEILRKGVRIPDTDALNFFHDKIMMDHDRYVVFFTGKQYAGMIIDAGKLLIKNGFSVAGTDLLEKISAENPDLKDMDEILYILGYSYQNDKSMRDERKAASYYKRIIEGYPSSLYWDSAKKEYLVLKRMYIDVR